MASMTGLAQGYAKRLRDAVDPNAEVGAIKNEIESLVSSDTGFPLSRAEKLRIIDLFEDEFRISDGPPPGHAGTTAPAMDNKRYLELVKALRGLLYNPD